MQKQLQVEQQRRSKLEQKLAMMLNQPIGQKVPTMPGGPAFFQYPMNNLAASANG